MRQTPGARSPGVRQAANNSEFVDDRPEAIAQRKLAGEISNSARVVTQRQRLRGMFGDAAEFKGSPEKENPLQGRFSLVQRMGLEYEAESMGAKAPAGALPGPIVQRRQATLELSSSHSAQLKNLSDKEVAQIDQKAWDTALAATLNHRPKNQEPVNIDDGEDDDQDAITRIRGKRNEILEVKYYPENQTFSRTNRSVRLGQMTALFNHELVYHGSHEVLANYNTDLEDADDEHFAMFDPARRENLLKSTIGALEQMTDVKARLAYINWWEADVKTHADWDESRMPSERLEGKKWATKTARVLRQRFVPKGGKRGRNDRDVSHRGPL